LYQKYVVERLSTYDIAKLVHRDPKQVYWWLKGYDIPTRPRGTNLKRGGGGFGDRSIGQRMSQNRKLGQISDKRRLADKELGGSHNYMNLIEDKTRDNPFYGKHHTEETKKLLSEKASCPKPYLRGENNGMYGVRGNKHPNWRGGVTPLRQALYSLSEWKEMHKAVLERDGYRCRRCGCKSAWKNKLNVHHMIPFPDSKFQITEDKLITLCRKCHSWVHSNQNINREFLEDSGTLLAR